MLSRTQAESGRRLMHKNPSSGKRSTAPFGKMDSLAKCMGSKILKVDTLPRRDAGTHLFGEGVNSMELTVFPEEAIFPQMLMHKKDEKFS